jgi:outer membrane protein TolC
MLTTPFHRRARVHTANPPRRRGLAAATGLLAVMLLAAPAGARETAPPPEEPVSLEEALEMALAYSPNLEEARQQREKAVHQKKESFTFFLPELSTSYSYQEDQNPRIFRSGIGNFQAGPAATYVWSTTVEQPIFTGFRLTSQYRLAELGVDLAKVNLHLARLDVALAVKEAYFNYLQAQKSLEVARQAVVQLESQLKVSQDFYDVGIIPINDVLKTKVNLANARQRRVEAANQVEVTQSRLNRLLGLSLETELAVEDILAYHPRELDYPEARAKARAHRPELEALGLRLAQSEQRIRSAKSEYYPQVGFTWSYDFTSDSPELGDSQFYDATGWTAAAVLDWSLWQWGRTRDRVNQRRADRLQLEATRRDLEDRVDLQVKEAILFLRDSATNIQTAKTSIVQAKENYRITKERYEEQLTTNTELLDAQTLLTEAQTNYYSALTVYNIAEARLLRAMGQGLATALEGDTPGRP